MMKQKIKTDKSVNTTWEVISYVGVVVGVGAVIALTCGGAAAVGIGFAVVATAGALAAGILLT